MMIAIIDYGVGNLFSLKSSFAAIGTEAVVTNDKSIIDKASHIILPGVGAFADAADKLRSTGMDAIVKAQALKGKPLMGICLGMQLLFDKSYEYGEYDGLGLIKGNIRSLADVIPENYKIPQIGWNSLEFKRESPIFRYISNGDYVYFVHSYFAADCDEAITAVTDYGAPVTASVESGNVFGCQFHPEKSGDIGLEILRAFCEIGGAL